MHASHANKKIYIHILHTDEMDIDVLNTEERDTWINTYGRTGYASITHVISTILLQVFVHDDQPRGLLDLCLKLKFSRFMYKVNCRRFVDF